MALDSKPETSERILIIPQQKLKKGSRKIWDIGQVQTQLPLVCKYILFLHVFLRFDTTSRIHGLGKGAPLEKFASNLALQECAKVFMNPEAN